MKYILDVLTPFLDVEITQAIVDEDGHEQEVTTRLRSNDTLVAWRYGGDADTDSQLWRCQDVTAQLAEQIQPDPNWTVRQVVAKSDADAAMIQADADLIALTCEEVADA